MPHRPLPLERLALTIVTCHRLEELLPQIALQFAEAVQADLAVVRLREGDRVATRAAVGFTSDGAREYAHPVAALAKRLCDPRPERLDLGDDRELIGEQIAAEGLESLHAVLLCEEDRTEGVVLLGWRRPVELDDDQRTLLMSLAAPVAPAIARFHAFAARDAAIADAQRALTLRDEVLGVVAHDLRNPLNVITTAVELMQARSGNDPVMRRHIDRIQRSVQRAERLVRDLLEVNAIEGSGLTIDRKPVEVVEVVLQALESQQILAASAQVVMTTDLSPSLPQVNADELRLQEVLENLISNAIKFNQAGGSVEIGAAPEGDGKFLRMWVRDSGAGIPSEHLPHVFDRFWQGVKRDRRGAGLGLAICRAIVDAHGGRIWAESSPGAGTVMSFTLPVTAPAKQAHDDEPVSILLVDDRPENLLALRAILDEPAYRLVTAATGEEALREALRDDFVLALIDVAMPGMDGLEVAGHLKKLSRYRDLPILFVTAFGDDPEEVHRAYAAGGADYIVKPLDAEVVRKKVAVFVELARRIRSSRVGAS